MPRGKYKPDPVRIHDDTPCMYIGQVAKLTGASHKAIRHYEAIGLIPSPTRKGSYRVYSERDLFLIHMIKTAQTVGFSLDDLRMLVELNITDKAFPLEFASALFDKKRKRLRNEIKDLKTQISRLDNLHDQMLTYFK